MAGQNTSFGPLGAPLSLSVGVASVNGILPGVGGDAAMVSNPSTTVQVAVKFSTPDQTPSPPVAAFNDANSIIINPNEARVVSMPIGSTQCAAIGSAAGPTALLVQRGSGGV